MKKEILFGFIVSLILSVGVFSQQINRLSSRCPAPNNLEYSQVSAGRDGNIYYDPCPNGSSIFSGAVVLPSGSAAVSGSGTTNYYPNWSNGANSILADTPYSWNGTLYSWDRGGFGCTFCMSFKPSAAGAGTFSVGSGTNFVSADENNVQIQANNVVDIVATAQAVRITTPAISIANDCVGKVTLDGAGTFDLTTKICWTTLGTRFVIATGDTANGIITFNSGTGKITSLSGAADSGRDVYYFITGTL